MDSTACAVESDCQMSGFPLVVSLLSDLLLFFCDITSSELEAKQNAKVGEPGDDVVIVYR